jgi:hypothetical protein
MAGQMPASNSSQATVSAFSKMALYALSIQVTHESMFWTQVATRSSSSGHIGCAVGAGVGDGVDPQSNVQVMFGKQL